jgi:hypothetical protein
LTCTALSFGIYHGRDARRRRAAQAGAEVVRILHAVEHEQQRRTAGGFDQSFEIVLVVTLRRGVVRDDALVPHPARDAFKHVTADRAHGNTGRLRDGGQFDQARIACTCFDQHLAHADDIVFERGFDRVDAGDPVLAATARHQGMLRRMC